MRITQTDAEGAQIKLLGDLFTELTGAVLSPACWTSIRPEGLIFWGKDVPDETIHRFEALLKPVVGVNLLYSGLEE